MENFQETIFSQYGNSPILCALIADFNAWIDPSANLDLFVSYVFDVSTAQGFGLDILGRIVGVTRVLTVTSTLYFGFNQQGTGVTTFGFGALYNGQGSLTNNVSLTDDAFRMLIMAKAAYNICDCSIPAINQILLSLFPGRGNPHVQDNANGSMVYVFDFALSPVELSIVTNSGVLPRPSGISVSVTHQ